MNLLVLEFYRYIENIDKIIVDILTNIDETKIIQNS